MLENLLNTKLKKKLLSIFFAFPQRSFAAAELKEMTGGRSPYLNQALREFAKAQVINVAARRQKRLFAINPYFRLYDELKDLVTDGEELAGEDEISRRIKRIPNLSLAVLSGVFTLQPKLPVDLLLVGEGTNRLKLQQTITGIEELIDQEINYAFLDPAEYEKRRMMNDRLVRDILDYPHIVVLDNLR